MLSEHTLNTFFSFIQERIFLIDYMAKIAPWMDTNNDLPDDSIQKIEIP